MVLTRCELNVEVQIQFTLQSDARCCLGKIGLLSSIGGTSGKGSSMTGYFEQE